MDAATVGAGPVGALCCPICRSARFEPFNGRIDARCTECRAVERTRLLYMFLDRFGEFRPARRVLHVAPELGLAKRFAGLSGERYHPCDIDPARYRSRYAVVRPLDLGVDLVKLPSASFDLIVHSHVLEHVAAPVEPVLAEMERILAPGGSHYLCVPVSGETTREDLSPDLGPEQRAVLFGQADHMRVFGRRDLPELLGRVWGPDDRMPLVPQEHFAAEALERAAIPREAWSGLTGHSIFRHVRPLARVLPGARRPPEAAAPAATAARPAGGAPPVLIHIGMPKTGTTSLQRWIAANRPALVEAGVEPWGVAENHSEAVFMACADPHRIARGAMWFQRPGPHGDGRALDVDEARLRLDRFLDGLGPRAGLISGEAMWSFGSAEVRRLADHVERYGRTAAILCWVRAPAEFLASAAQQRARSTLTTDDVATRLGREIVLGYDRLERWIAAFGREAVHVRPFVRDAAGDLVRLLVAFGFAATVPAGEPELNPSLRLLGAKALMALNAALAAPGGAAPAARSDRLAAVLRGLGEERFALPATALEALAPRFAREVDYLVDRFGLDRADLEPPVAAVDDAAFYGWTEGEVRAVLGAANAALLDAMERGRRQDGGGTSGPTSTQV